MSLLETATEGDRLKSLRSLRDALAVQLDQCESARDYAALSLRFMDALEQIADIEARLPQPKGTPLDEFTKRRSAKAQAPRASRAAGSGE